MLVGALIAIGSLVAVALCGGSAWRSWLAAAYLVASGPVGSLGLLMILRLVPGDWRGELAPMLETQIRFAPAAGLVCLPVLFVLAAIYPWMHQQQPTGFRAIYLSAPFFIGRSVLWWGLLVALMSLLSGSRGHRPIVSAVGLILYATLGSMTAVDWLMSLDPAFTSSGFSLYVICIQMLLALSLCIAAGVGFSAPLAHPAALGGVLLTALMLWGYLAFMQYVIVWSGDLPKGAAWYLHRARGGWDLVTWAVAASRLVPLLCLLFGPVRRGPGWLLCLSLTVVAGTALEIAWLVFPADGGPVRGRDLALYAFAVAGLTMAGTGAFRTRLRRGGALASAKPVIAS
jgi:hypothetical protein